eukprot:5315649-Amphidinium_carterae.1
MINLFGVAGFVHIILRYFDEQEGECSLGSRLGMKYASLDQDPGWVWILGPLLHQVGVVLTSPNPDTNKATDDTTTKTRVTKKNQARDPNKL